MNAMEHPTVTLFPMNPAPERSHLTLSLRAPLEGAWCGALVGGVLGALLGLAGVVQEGADLRSFTEFVGTTLFGIFLGAGLGIIGALLVLLVLGVLRGTRGHWPTQTTSGRISGVLLGSLGFLLPLMVLTVSSRDGILAGGTYPLLVGIGAAVGLLARWRTRSVHRSHQLGQIPPTSPAPLEGP